MLSGQRFGHIRVNHHLGEGGMGTVYAGFDETLRRRVAVKVLQSDQRLDPEARVRLIREARSLSQLDHPNICRIYDYIEGDDADLLILEYIEGKTLRDAIEAGLSPAEKLHVSTALANVLVAAHRAGIIHRDLKPENVMLTPEGQVKVLDFGLAAWLEDRTARESPRMRLAVPHEEELDRSGSIHLRTMAGMALGTPLYMSPEQARGEQLTAASDIYSFGLLLQTLFTGSDPYPAYMGARDVMLMASRGESLPVTGVDRDVAALINSLKSLAPTDRPTAAEATRRLALIVDKPKRLIRRAVAAVLLAVFLSGIGKYTFDLRRERAAALAAEHRAVVAQREAATRRAQAEDLITFMLGDLRKKLEPIGKLDLLDDVGERALTYSGSLQPSLMTAAELARSAKVLNQLGDVRILQGRLPDAAVMFARARSLAQAAVAKDASNQEAQLALMAAYFGHGDTARRRGDLAESLQHNELYLATARRLSAAWPNNEDYRLETAYAHATVGTLLMSDARYTEARKHFEEAMRIKLARIARDPMNLEWQADLANTINKVGVNLMRTGDLSGARKQFEAQKQISQKLVAFAPDHATWKQSLALSHAFLGSALLRTGALAEAEREYEAELRIERSLAEIDPENTGWQRNLAVTMSWVAALRARRGLAAEADVAFREAEKILEDVIRRDSGRVSHQNDLAFLRARWAMSSLQRRDLGRARAVWQRAWTLLGERPRTDAASRPSTLEVILTGIAVARAAGDRKTLDELQTRADALFAQAPMVSSSDPEVLALRARLLVTTSRAEEAEPLIVRLTATGYRHPDYEWSVNAR
ncbi:MAG TPA: protein kinase [Thermoanaerobaculia bacterium]|jgi:serine/threonine-protein kinase